MTLYARGELIRWRSAAGQEDPTALQLRGPRANCAPRLPATPPEKGPQAFGVIADTLRLVRQRDLWLAAGCEARTRTDEGAILS